MQNERVFIGLDDTDDKDSPRGTGRLARLLLDHLRDRFPRVSSLGVLRLQLPIDPRIPYTSHNSSACLLLDVSDAGIRLGELEDAAHAFVSGEAAPGSDPGVCIADSAGLHRQVVRFALKTASQVVERREAEQLARHMDIRLAPLGGDGGGVIGALAAVGLAAQGNCGRYIDLGPIRDLEETVTAGRLRDAGIEVISMDREGRSLEGWETIGTGGWLRPRRIGSSPVVFVEPGRDGWACYDKKQRS